MRTHTHQLANYCGPHTTWVCTLAPSNLGLQRGNTHQLSHLCGRYKFIKLLGVKGHKKFRQLVTHTHTSLLINMSVGRDSFKIVTVPLKSGRLATMAKVVAVLHWHIVQWTICIIIVLNNAHPLQGYCCCSSRTAIFTCCAHFSRKRK